MLQHRNAPLQEADGAFPTVSSDVAFRATMENGEARMPPLRDEAGETWDFATPAPRPSFRLEPGESLFTIGSCFARGVEYFLSSAGFDLPTLRFKVPAEELSRQRVFANGLLNRYNPYSITNEFRFSCENVPPETCFAGEEKVVDLHLHSGIAVPRERAVERRLELHQINREGIAASRVFVVTLGLIEVWYDTHNEVFINGTPDFKLAKRQPDRFLFRVMSPDETMDAVEEIVTTIGRYARPDHRIILTVSPVPLGRTFSRQDIMSANAYSKSCLRTAAEAACRKFEHVDYFPSYETVLYSNREKSWLPDYVHVTTEMVAHNVRRMVEFYT
ncbi:hypothetical protein E4O86_14575 [Rhizobiales bacterium L72]|uniref:GSCFA domain-containing protein n=2 Tax=Propylenella binzhouense TaxID=2555902 RepID=A0A964WUB4_9HYPH|nr:hypothetical protein [Propylenella binzhouense]